MITARFPEPPPEKVAKVVLIGARVMVVLAILEAVSVALYVIDHHHHHDHD